MIIKVNHLTWPPTDSRRGREGRAGGVGRIEVVLRLKPTVSWDRGESAAEGGGVGGGGRGREV